jgi:putative Holliday junction resolvase
LGWHYDNLGRMEARTYIKKLEKLTKVKCEYVDERLTSFEARQNLGELKTDLIDAHAAKILIDNWFNKS